MDEKLPPELQEIADLLWESAQGAPPVEDDKAWWAICSALWESEFDD